MREETVTRYYADDGSMFFTKEECEHYEANCQVDFEKELPDLFVSELSNTIPLAFVFKCHKIDMGNTWQKYQWFKLKNKEDFGRVQSILEIAKALKVKTTSHLCLREPNVYPNLLAVEMSIPAQLMGPYHYTYTGRYTYYSEQMETVESYKKKVEKFI